VRVLSSRRRWLLGLLAGPLVLAGCASGGSGGSAATGTSGSAATGTSGTTTHAAAVEAAQYASNTPPPAATMVCDEDELRSAIAAGLGVDSVPAGTSTWADHVYTCTFTTPLGRLVMSVTVTPGNADARGRLAALRTSLAATTQEPGLGQEAYSAASGTVVAVKDNMVLTVDPGGLPDDIGATHEHRLDFARVLAAAVFSCWTGNG
jgi:hypothetical protein